MDDQVHRIDVSAPRSGKLGRRQHADTAGETVTASGRPDAIPFAPPQITEDDIAAVVEVLRSGWITTGPVAAEFEREIAQLGGVPRATVTNSGTASIELALRMLGIGPGDEVITSAYTYTATLNAIVHTGATPVLADVAPGSFLIDPDSVAARITPRTRAVLAVDIGGLPCDYPALADVIQDAPQPRVSPGSPGSSGSPAADVLGRIALLSDAAHSLGAEIDASPAASLVDMAAFSFHAVKNLTTAEGGALAWSAQLEDAVPHLYRDASVLGMHGQSKNALAKSRPGQWEYDVTLPGYKWNMPDVLAALGLSQLRRYAATLERRHELVRRYDEALAQTGLEILRPVHVGPRHRSSAHLYMVRLPHPVEVRNQVIQGMAERGIATNVHFKPIPMLTAYRWLGDPAEVAPQALQAYHQELSLPLHLALTEDDVDRVVTTLAEVLEQVQVPSTIPDRSAP